MSDPIASDPIAPDPIAPDPIAPDPIARGRAELAQFIDQAPTDFYDDDLIFKALVVRHGLEARAPAFHAAGRAAAGPLDAAARENDLHHPTLDDWDGAGRPRATLAHHPSYHEAGRQIYGAGVLAAYAESPTPHRFATALFYLTGQAGEAGHNCPVACGAGAIRVVQHLGTDDQRARYLPGLLNPDYDTGFTASQFLTEVQGGSDVGANACHAEPLEGGLTAGSRWALSGEKWFCSNADADVFIMTARVQAGPPGTAGLGMFVVPRLRPDGSPNGFRIRRLKQKLGTRTMATAEIDFDGAVAEALGPVGQGFRNVMLHVINTSRLYNAMGCAAHARRAWVVASTYARCRTAFGNPIARFGPVAETLATMRADAGACLASTLWIAQVREAIDEGRATADQQAFFRVAVNLNKMWTAMVSHEAVNSGIEVLAGNGTIETFSVLPRLLRDNVVYENWEGAHNVLRAQVLRDCARMRVHEGFFEVLAHRLPGEIDALAADRAAVVALLELPDGPLRDLRWRPLAKRLATWVMLGGLATPGDAGADLLQAVARLTRRHLGPPEIDADYLSLIMALQR